MESRREVFKRLWGLQNEAGELLNEYDSIPHLYGDHVLYQADGHIIDLIAGQPGITITELGEILKKTPSACSQAVKRLINKGWVEQRRNEKNLRVYNLLLTENGQKVYQDRQVYNIIAQELVYNLLKEITDDQLKSYIKVQKKMNEAYSEAIAHSKSELLDREKRRV